MRGPGVTVIHWALVAQAVTVATRRLPVPVPGVRVVTSCGDHDSPESESLVHNFHFLADSWALWQETALLRLCDNFGITKYYRDTYKIVHSVPFSSATKFSAVICTHDAFPGLHIVMLKGAPEIILTKCVNYVRHDSILPIDADFTTDQQRAYERLAGENLLILL